MSEDILDEDTVTPSSDVVSHDTGFVSIPIEELDKLLTLKYGEEARKAKAKESVKRWQSKNTAKLRKYAREAAARRRVFEKNIIALYEEAVAQGLMTRHPSDPKFNGEAKNG